MSIRAFLTTWQLIGSDIHNPIIDHIDSQPDLGIIASMIYPDADANGLPDKPLVLILVESQQVPGAVLEQLRNLAGVTLIPSARPDKPIATLPPSAKSDLDGLAAAHGIPQSAINNAATLGEALTNIEKYIAPNSNGVARYLAARPAEFG